MGHLQLQSIMPGMPDEPGPVAQHRVTLQRIRFYENGYLIGQATRPDQKNSSITILGNMLSPKVGQEYELRGSITFSDRFNCHEIRFSAYRTLLPNDNDGILRYLVRVAAWVGPSVGKSIVERYGPDSLAIIRENPERIASEISGITLDRARQMSDSLRENAERETALVEILQVLAGHAPDHFADKIYAKFGKRATLILKRSPFRMSEIRGIGFATADKIHQAMKKPPTSLRRHAAAVAEAMRTLTVEHGSTEFSEAAISRSAQNLLNGDLDPRAIMALFRTRKFVLVDAGCWARRRTLAEAKYVASKIKCMTEQSHTPVPISIDGLSADQVRACSMAAEKGAFTLVGPPGTGKTFTASRVVQSFIGEGKQVVLVAPTGKAAKVLETAVSRVVSCSASTIHSAIGLLARDDEDSPLSNEPARNIKCDLLVVDETGFVDHELFYHLLKAVDAKTRIMFIGDHHQLPSVGAGDTLQDLMSPASGVPCARLEKIQRNAGDIVRACHAIKDGLDPSHFAAVIDPQPVSISAIASHADTDHNWIHIPEGNADSIISIIQDLWIFLPQEMGLDAARDIQVMSPHRSKGRLSCASINRVIQEVVPHDTFNPPIKIKTQKGEQTVSIYDGDKIINLINIKASGSVLRPGEPASSADFNQEVRVVNGDIGTTVSTANNKMILEFDCPRRIVRISPRDSSIDLGYCITVHKMQGSESPVAILPLHKEFTGSMIWNRNLIYTAMSRAKRLLITVGSLASMQSAITKLPEKRNSLLNRCLRSA